MNKIVSYGLATAAIIVLVVLGAQFILAPRPANVGLPASATPEPTPDPTSSASAESVPSPTVVWAGLPRGPFVVTGSEDPVQVTLDIQQPHWSWLPQFAAVSKGDDGLDPPETRGGALIAWSWPAGTGFHVYGDPCQWSSTVPGAAATTPDEIASALAAQAMSNPSDPVDVTVSGYAGKRVVLETPMSFHLPGASREERFADCDNAIYGFYGVAGETEPARNAQGGGEVDELWILDVEGAILILNATYGPAADPGLVDELRTLAETAVLAAP